MLSVERRLVLSVERRLVLAVERIAKQKFIIMHSINKKKNLTIITFIYIIHIYDYINIKICLVNFSNILFTNDAKFLIFSAFFLLQYVLRKLFNLLQDFLIFPGPSVSL